MPKILGVQEASINSKYALEEQNNMFIPKKEFSLVYIVLADNCTQTDDDIVATVGIPTLFYTLRGCFCKTITPKESSSIRHPVTGVATILWEVTCEFDSQINPGDQQTDPEDIRPKVGWTSEFEEEHFAEDLEGTPVQTIPGEPIFMTNQRVCPILEIERIESYPFDPNVILNYVDTTNSTAFWGAPKGTVLMLPMEVREETIDGDVKCRVTYRLKFNLRRMNNVIIEDTWTYIYVLHEGFKRRRFIGDKDPITNTDLEGNPMKCNLDQNGLKQDEGATFISFKRKELTDFNTLSLGPF